MVPLPVLLTMVGLLSFISAYVINSVSRRYGAGRPTPFGPQEVELARGIMGGTKGRRRRELWYMREYPREALTIARVLTVLGCLSLLSAAILALV
jgi:hypothetical protein